MGDVRVSREVVLVAGPPCGGKTTFVRSNAAPEDVVLDFDDIARQLGSGQRWTHGKTFRAGADEAMWERMTAVRAMTEDRAWVIRCLPDAGERQLMARWLGANRVVVCLPSQETLMRRAQQRPRRIDTVKGIRQWLSRYSPASCDEVVSEAVPA